MTAPEGPAGIARQALAGRRERVLLDDPTVLAVAEMLVRRCRRPEHWVRAAVATIDRFRREVAADDLPALLDAGRADLAVAEASLDRLSRRHDGLTGGQLASLAFGPRLWWTTAGVPVSWRPLTGSDGSLPLPGSRTDRDVRLLLLAVIGTGATEGELLGAHVRDAGRLDAEGGLVPDLSAEPLAVAYRSAEDGAEHLTFLSYEARAALQDGLAARGALSPDDPLLLPAGQAGAASEGVRASSAALIGAGNDVNVTLCRATGDFFRAWGMPGARFDLRNAQEST